MKISKSQLKRIIKEEIQAALSEEAFYEVDALDINEEYCPVCRESQELEEKKKRKKACKPRSAGIKKCKNPPCANTLSRRKWKCRGKKSMAE